VGWRPYKPPARAIPEGDIHFFKRSEKTRERMLEVSGTASCLTKIFGTELILPRNDSGTHGPVFMGALGPGDASILIDPDCEPHSLSKADGYHVNSGMWLTVPNLFTFLRVLMTPYILVELARGEYMIAGWTFGVAAFTDTMDGYIARRFHAESRVGLYLDPIADKLLLSSIYIGLMLGHAIPAWVVAVVFGRDLWILSLSGIALKFTEFRELKPSVWGKASTFIQIMTAVAIMAAHAYQNAVFGQIADIMIWGIVALALISAGDYTARGIGFWLRKGRVEPH
jgi:cardiolipin synthase